MAYFDLKRDSAGGEEAIAPHSSTHHAGGTDALSAEAIGARPIGIDIDWGELANNPIDVGRDHSSEGYWSSINISNSTLGSAGGIDWYINSTLTNAKFSVSAPLGGPEWFYLFEFESVNNQEARLITGLVPWEKVVDKPSYFPPFSAPVTYGNVTVSGSSGGYSGIRFADSQGPSIFMVRNVDGLSGVYRVDTSSWRWYFDGNGTLIAGTVPYSRTTGVAASPESALNLTYGTGWSAYGGSWPSSFRKMDKLVVLSALVKRAAVNANTIATLPIGYRPVASEMFTVYGYIGTTYTVFRVDVLTTGAVNIAFPTSASAIDFLSLSGISFFTA